MPKVERRLVAILAADVAGFSGHAEADETGTLERLHRLRAEADRQRLAQELLAAALPP